MTDKPKSLLEDEDAFELVPLKKTKASDCGANTGVDGGFGSGNDCAAGDGGGRSDSRGRGQYEPPTKQELQEVAEGKAASIEGVPVDHFEGDKDTGRAWLSNEIDDVAGEPDQPYDNEVPSDLNTLDPDTKMTDAETKALQDYVEDSGSLNNYLREGGEVGDGDHTLPDRSDAFMAQLEGRSGHYDETDVAITQSSLEGLQEAFSDNFGSASMDWTIAMEDASEMLAESPTVETLEEVRVNLDQSWSDLQDEVFNDLVDAGKIDTHSQSAHEMLKLTKSNLRPGGKPVRVFRGIALNSWDEEANDSILKQALNTDIGDTMRFTGFASTSRDQKFAEGFAQQAKNRQNGGSSVVYVIDAKKGAAIERVSSFEDEQEIVLGPTSKFTVKERRWTTFRTRRANTSYGNIAATLVVHLEEQ